MAVSAKWYGNAFKAAFNKEVDWDTDTVKVMLCTSSYTPDQDAHDYKNDITNEITGTGYTAGGAALTSKTSTYTGGTNTLALDAADTVWTTSTLTARYAVIYVDTGTGSTSPLLGYADFGVDFVSTAGPFTLQWDAAGILTQTVT